MNATTEASTTVDSRNVRLGSAPRGATLEFGIAQDRGFEANAILLLGTQTISTWVSSELMGKTDTVPLVSSGQYQLQISGKFTTTQETTVQMTFEIRGDAGSIIARSKSFTGKRGGIARAIADVFVP
jgi:hypothetical protein